MTSTLTVGSLFSGIGGIDLGLQRAGMRTIWFCETDAYCQRVLRKHWPGVPIYGDIRELDCTTVARPDALVGGFPCQPHSLAGKRKGKDDERNLWPEFRRVIGELRPTWVLGENVPGIRTTILDDILDNLEALGYAARTFDIPAVAVGAPHLRHRFFIVAHTNDSGFEIDTQLDSESQNHSAEWSTYREHPGGLCDAMADANRAGYEEQRRPEPVGTEQRSTERSGTEVADANGRRCEQCEPSEWGLSESDAGRREVEPMFRRVADGLPHGLDRLYEQWRYGEWPGVERVTTVRANRVARLRCLGNAVVPQVAELVGRMIVAAGAVAVYGSKADIGGRKGMGDHGA